MKRNTNSTRNKQDCRYLFEVNNVKDWGNNVTFTLVIDGEITIYGMRIVESSRGNFVGFPSRKGSDGNFYNRVYMKLSEDEEKKIIELVEKQL